MRLAIRLLVGLMLVSVLTGQDYTFYGRYVFTSAAPIGADGTCQFTGQGDITQAGSTLGGGITQSLIAGPMACPPFLRASLLATTDGTTVMGTLNGGAMFGTASIFGTMTPDGFQGSFATSPNGPFGELEGTWAATREPVSEIPALGPWGMVLLASVLVAAGIIFLRHRRLPT